MNKKSLSTLSLLVLSVQAGIRRGVEKAKIKLENEYEPKNTTIKKIVNFLRDFDFALHRTKVRKNKQK